MIRRVSVQDERPPIPSVNPHPPQSCVPKWGCTFTCICIIRARSWYEPDTTRLRVVRNRTCRASTRRSSAPPGAATPVPESCAPKRGCTCSCTSPICSCTSPICIIHGTNRTRHVPELPRNRTCRASTRRSSPRPGAATPGAARTSATSSRPYRYVQGSTHKTKVSEP